MAKFGDGARAYIAQAKRAIESTVRIDAAVRQEHMQRYAPWTDRTGKARENLRARVVRRNVSSEIQLTIVLTHGDGTHETDLIEYGKYLEGSNGGMYAIVQPTAERMRRELGRQINRALPRG